MSRRPRTYLRISSGCLLASTFVWLAALVSLPASPQNSPRTAVPKVGASVPAGAKDDGSCSSAAGNGACGAPVMRLPDGWQVADVGTPLIEGATAPVRGVFALGGSGRDVNGTRDQFHYAYTQARGDVDVIARLRRVDTRRRQMTAGVMLRASLDPSAADAFVYVSGRNALGFRHRPSSGAQTLDAPGISQGLPVWLKLELRSQVVSAYSSTNGQSWQFVKSEIVALPSTFSVGLAVTSGQTDEVATAIFDRVDVREMSGGTSPDVDAAQNSSDGGSTSGPGTGPATGSGGSEPPPQTPAPSTSDGTPPPATSTPRFAVFVPSSDHAANVDRYVLEIVRVGGGSVAQQDLGKPIVVNGECRVDITALLGGLTPGNYVAVVRAVNRSGQSAPAQSAPFSV
jgi:hypothetical protein